MHTNGPWALEQCGKSFYIQAKDFYDICVVKNSGNEDNLSNARLISSAPDLLSALENIVSCFSEENIIRAIEAIKKAKGEE